MSELAERVRLRLREEMSRKGLSQQDVADLIKWTQSKVAQKVRMSTPTPITMEELETLAFAVGLAPTELVRDHGLEFCAEMTPTELRVLERIRQLRPDQLDALMTMLAVTLSTRKQERRAGSVGKKPRMGRG